jgi:zinc transport system permease protein
MAYLFGDILAVSHLDLAIIWRGALLILILVMWRWFPLLNVTLNEDLSYASGFNPKREKFLITLSIGLTVAVVIKVVGVLLIVAMLIIPAAAAQTLAQTPEAMAVIATIIGAASAVLGLRTAFVLDTPARAINSVCRGSFFYYGHICWDF